MTDLPVVKPRTVREQYVEFKRLKRSYVREPVIHLDIWKKFRKTEEEFLRRVKIEDQESSKKK